MTHKKTKVLFLCAHNACRSQIAEAMLRHYGGDDYEVQSAGLRATEIHPLTLQVLGEEGIDTAGLSAKDVKQFLGRFPAQFAIFVCEQTQQHCPRIFPGVGKSLYWPFEDPAQFRGSESQRLDKFREVRDQIRERIQKWLGEQRQQNMAAAQNVR